jgi:hypothetical protein
LDGRAGRVGKLSQFAAWWLVGSGALQCLPLSLT